MLHACLQVNFEPGNRVSWGDVQLELLQYHFHTPSEHAWDGQRSAMEAHLVHRNTATGMEWSCACASFLTVQSSSSWGVGRPAQQHGGAIKGADRQQQQAQNQGQHATTQQQQPKQQNDAEGSSTILFVAVNNMYKYASAQTTQSKKGIWLTCSYCNVVSAVSLLTLLLQVALL
jgi:hypothetical protein